MTEGLDTDVVAGKVDLDVDWKGWKGRQLEGMLLLLIIVPIAIVVVDCSDCCCRLFRSTLLIRRYCCCGVVIDTKYKNGVKIFD